MAIIYVDIDGGKLAVEVDGDGPLIICTPGIGDTRDAYSVLALELVRAGYRVARVDLRAHGESTATFQHYGDEATADDYLAVIKALGGGPAVLVGASLSSGAAVIVAGKHPENVAGLVLTAPFLRSGASKIMLWFLRLLFLWPWGPYVWRSYAPSLYPSLGDKAREHAAKKTSLLTRPGYWTPFQATFAGADHDTWVTPWIEPARDAPTLVVMGDKDIDWADPVAEAVWVSSNFTNVETCIVSGAGHAPAFEKPDVVAPALLRFLEKINFDGKQNTSSGQAGSRQAGGNQG